MIIALKKRKKKSIATIVKKSSAKMLELVNTHNKFKKATQR